MLERLRLKLKRNIWGSKIKEFARSNFSVLKNYLSVGFSPLNNQLPYPTKTTK